MRQRIKKRVRYIRQPMMMPGWLVAAGRVQHGFPPGSRCEQGWTGDRCRLPLFHEGQHDNETPPTFGEDLDDITGD